MNSVMIAPLFSSFIKPGTFFIDEWTIIFVIDRVIVHVKSANVVLHDFLYIVALDVIHEIVRISVHDFTFLAHR